MAKTLVDAGRKVDGTHVLINCRTGFRELAEPHITTTIREQYVSMQGEHVLCRPRYFILLEVWTVL